MLGVDNPDTPDLMAQFQARASIYKSRIGGETARTNDIVVAYAAYQRFLDEELTHFYELLAGKLAPLPRGALVQSQQQWRRYRTSEFRFIDGAPRKARPRGDGCVTK